MDTFYIESFSKFLLLMFCLTGFFLVVQDSSTLDFNFGVECFIFIIVAMLLTRIVGNMFIRTELYKYFYTEMHIIISIMVFIFIGVYIFSLQSYYFQFLTSSTILIGLYSFLLLLSIYAEGNNRLTINLDLHNTRKSDFYVEMDNF